MDIDLSQFFQVFFEESAEHLAEMERILLAIDVANPDEEELNAIFRAAHSIKGGAGTFGFPDMTGVTHALETLLDRIRHRELALTGEMVDVFLRAGDVITMQLAGHRDKSQVDRQEVQAVCERLSAISGGAIQKDQTHNTIPASSPSMHKNTETTYRIVFNAPPDLFTRMVRMEPIFDELATMGEFTVTARIEPPETFADYDPTRCITIWEMTLTTGHTPEDITEVFMFVADEDELSVEALTPPADGEATPAPTQATLPETMAGGGSIMGRRQSDREETAPGAFGRRTVDHIETSSIRVGVSKVDQLINQVGELVITQLMLAQTASALDPVDFANHHRTLAQLERNTRELQQNVMSIRMMPISFVFSRFPRMVRELAAKLGKQVELKTIGDTTELDKGLIEKIADPLTHLVRNCLDHALETPEARCAAGKEPTGTLTLRAAQTGGRVVIDVIDDGAGLSRVKILDKAAERGIPCSDTMSDDDVWQLIFAPGFSTAEVVTDISGRGVGMDVVLRNVQAMNGKVNITSEAGKGTRVTISLPLTLAILDGLSVAVGDDKYIIPLGSIIESLQPSEAHLKTVGNSTVVQVRGDYIPIIPLYELFNMKALVTEPEQGILVLVDADGEKAALLVDALLDEHQVVIKSMETNYRKVEGTAGATILGDGRVALILDVASLLQMRKRTSKMEGAA